MPEENARAKGYRDRAPYQQWAASKHMTLTPGNVIDYRYIRRDINKIAEKYQLQAIAFDPWNASQLCESELLHEDGLPMVKMRQGFASMSAPTKHLESLVLRGDIKHGGNPVLRYHAASAAVRGDPAGNIKIDKARSTERVDGMVALVMAVGRAMASYEKPSPYTDRGIVSL